MTRRRPTPRGVLFVVLVGHAAWLLAHWEPACVGADAVGVCAQARHVAEEGFADFRPASPAALVGSHWVEVGEGAYRGRFPPGWPALLGAARAALGPSAALALTPFAATAAVGLAYLAAAALGGAWAGVAAAALLATLPLANRLALHGDTHVPAAACALLGAWLLLRWDRAPTRGRAFAAGVAWGALPAIRYAEALLAAAAGVFVLVESLRRRDRGAAHAGAALAGSAVPLGLLLAHNAAAYGAPWRTGYAFTNEQTAFSLAALPGNLAFYAGHLATPGGAALLVLLGAAGVALLLRRPATRPAAVFLAAAAAAPALLYGAYYWGAREVGELALRFFLPGLALLAVAAGAGAARLGGRARAAAGAALAVQVLLGAWGSQRALADQGAGLERGRAVVAAASAVVPEDAVLVAPRAVAEVLEWGGDWRLVPQWLLPGTPERAELLLPWEVPEDLARRESDTPAPAQIARGAASRAHYRGLRGEPLARAVLADAAAWAPGMPVYWMGDPRVVARVDALLGGGRFEPVAEVLFPDAPVGEGEWWVPRGPLVVFRLVEPRAGG